MNLYNGWCSTNGSNFDDFEIPTDDEGNSLLTGSGKGQSDDKKREEHELRLFIKGYWIIFLSIKLSCKLKP